MYLIVKELEATSSHNQQDGNLLDFRSSNHQCFFIDRSLKVIQPNKKYKITIELIQDDIVTNDIIIKE